MSVRNGLEDRVIGVLGGMGPLATADFMREVILCTPAEGDADHIPMIVVSCPQIPDRVAPILTGRGESPLPAIRERRDLLVRAGAKCIAMPCNTAHYWLDDLAADCPVPFLSILDATVDDVAARIPPPAAVGLIGTAATLHGGLFQKRLEERGYRCLVPDEQGQSALVAPAIALVKKNELAGAAPLFVRAIEALLGAGARLVVLACTEVPAALRDRKVWLEEHCVDSTAALARACVRWALGG